MIVAIKKSLITQTSIKMKYVLNILLFIYSINVFAQNKPTVLIRLTNTPKGIFVEFGDKSLIGRSFELWRKAGTETTFKKIASLKTPDDQNEVVRRIAESQTVFAEGSRPETKDLNDLWTKYKEKKPNILNLIAIIPQLEFVFGMAYMDTEARPNEKYQYQIIETRNILATSNTLIHLRYRKFPSLIASKLLKKDQMIQIEFGFPAELQLSTKLHVQRKIFAGKNTDYSTIAPVVRFTTNKNKVSTMVMLDTSLTAYSSYNYRIKVRDIWGNSDSSYTYLNADNILEAQLSELKQIKIESSKDTRAFIITWNMTRKEIIQSLKLYRSTQPDGKYQVVANLNAKDIVVTDPVQIANELYHYYFEITDIFGNIIKTARFHGIYDGLYKPSPPINLRATPTPQGLDLSWQSSDLHTRGYYVFRKQGAKGDFLQISPLLTKASYMDTVKLDAEYTHFYAVKSESDTYDKSNFSDSVAYRPTATKQQVTLKPPFDLNAVFRDGKVRISWENLNADIPQVLGYQVFRKKEAEREYKLLTAQPLMYKHNYYEDSTFLSDDTYQYVIASTDLQDKFSLKSQPVSINLVDKFIMTPQDIGAEVLSNGIKLKWTEIEVARVKQIKIYRAEENSDFKLLKSIDSKLKEFLDTTTGKGKSYVYQISTLDLAGKESKRSDPFVVNF